MIERFKTWRNDLTYDELIKVMWILGGIFIAFGIIRLLMIFFREETLSLYSAFISLIAIIVLEILAEFLTWFILNGNTKQWLKKDEILYEQYKQKMGENTYIKVFFHEPKCKLEGDALELYTKMKKCKNPSWFAKIQNERMYIQLKNNNEVVFEVETANMFFFKINFRFTEE